ncbi:MAG: hypothetical protein Q3996_00765 [Candidatus Saccharibacteria bacterium]|nr:hypothetical protein [Candidatus Saccharibacteria bacterium]
MSKKAPEKMKMIEINLLPNIKQEMLNARRMRDQVMVISIIVTAIAVTVVLIMTMMVFLVQGLIISSQKSQIESDFGKYKNYTGASEILTLQNQLTKLKDIHSKKSITSRIFVLLSQIVARNNLDIKTSTININPHNNQITIEAFSETGYVELERLIKTLQDAKISYIDTKRFMEIGKKRSSDDQKAEQKNDSQSEQSEEAVDPDKQLDQELKENGFSPLLNSKISLLSDPAFGENSEGRKVLTFKIGFSVQEEFFKSGEKHAIIEGIGYQDVTDSYLSIPQNLFGSLKNDKTETKDQQTEGGKE